MLGTTLPVIDYVENGVTTAHAIPFQFRLASEIKVTRTTVAGLATVLVQGPDYSVAGGAGGTGTVNKVNGGTNLATLRIERVTSRAQGVDLVPGGDFPAETNEQAFDRLSQVDQEQDFILTILNALATRALVVPVGEAGAAVPAIAARKGLYFKFDAVTGLPIAANPAADFVGPTITVNFTTLAPGAAGTFDITGAWPDLTWNIGLPRGTPGASGALGDGDYGDIIVSGAGTVLTVEPALLAAKANLAGATFTGNVLFGTAVAAGIPNPLKIQMGGTFSNTAGANPKLEIFWDGADRYGFGVSSNQLDYIAPIGATHNFYINAVKVAEITPTAFKIGGVDVRHARIQSVASAAAVTPTFADDQVNVTAQAVALAIANPTGTAIPSHGIVLRIKDNGVARAISWGAQYRAMGAALKTTTTAGKTMYIPMVYHAEDAKWDVGPAWQEA